MSFLKEYLPVFRWLPNYQRQYISADLLAGITVAVMLIPQVMAYALIAGLPPVAGLYAALASIVVYAIFGGSRQLGVGPVALDSLLVASGVGAIAAANSEEYLILAMMLAVMVGIIQFVSGVAKLGFLANFLSNPVLSGFTSAAVIIIALNQVKYLTGAAIPRFQNLIEIVRKINPAHLQVDSLTLIIGFSGLLFLVLIKRFSPAIPGALLLVALTTVLSALFNWEEAGVDIVGAIPEGLPGFAWPAVSLEKVGALVPVAMTIALLSYMEAIAVTKKLAAKINDSVDANQELRGLGLANVATGFFGGFPVAGSFSRSAVNARAGAKTAMASLTTAAVIALTLLFLTPLFYYLPNSVLAAIIVAAVISLVDLQEMHRLYRTKGSDFIVWISAFLATLFFGILYGIFLSVVMSLVMILRRISHPHIAIMGQVPGTDVIRNLDREPAAEEVDGLLIFRIDASLYFANVAYLRDQLHESIAEHETWVKAVLIDASSINEIDTSAEAALREIRENLLERGTQLYFSNVKGPVRDMLKRSGFYDLHGKDHFFLSKQDVVQAFQARRAPGIH